MHGTIPKCDAKVQKKCDICKYFMHIFAIYKPCKYQLATLASDGSYLAILKPCRVTVPRPMGYPHAAASTPTTPTHIT